MMSKGVASSHINDTGLPDYIPDYIGPQCAKISKMLSTMSFNLVRDARNDLFLTLFLRGCDNL